MYFERQIVLYLTLAVAFAALLLAERFVAKHKQRLASPPLIIGVGVLACLTTGASAFSLHLDLSARLVMTVFLGLSEALVMYVRLHYFTTLALVRPFRTLATDMIVGGLIALLVGSLVSPADLVATACLPLVAVASLMARRSRFGTLTARRDDACAASCGQAPQELSAWKMHDKAGCRYVLKRLIPTAVFALVSGLVQGAFLANGIALLLASNSMVFTGIVLAGVIVFFILERPCTHADIDMIHRFSLMLFVCGVVGLSLVGALTPGVNAPPGGGVLIVSEIAILAGFNLFGFGGLVVGIGLVRRFGGGSALFMDGGRVAVYASLAAGLAGGTGIVLSFGAGDLDAAILFVCGLSVLLLVATVLVPSFNQDSFDDLIAQVPDGASGSSRPLGGDLAASL